ncbi:hypothetical protein CAPTEDRAFT_226713 [Capitella teleta]|uniref:Uncharacterized protein n=1 Tax=Capitella teleta TaxID=283909 RepID=R7TW62_CAPTE|nr:hypothetical protein CAPTEDRAFT_226713 [Capitella teleta]|eukprot:ELT97797.1 hypothetical protein CAPTEDRAFT_226713 [Capitella teleta]
MERIIKFRQIVRYLLVVAVWLCETTAFVENKAHDVTSSNRFYDVIMRDFWFWRLEDSPEFAAGVGMQQQGHRLDSFSVQAFDHSQRKAREFLRMIDSVSLSEMNTRDIRNLHLLESDIETFLRGYNWRLHGGLNPVDCNGGVHTDFIHWLDAMSFDDIEAYDEYSMRLTALASQVHEQIVLMKEAMRLKITNHRLAMFEKITDPGGTRERLKRHTAAVIKDHVLPAFKKLSEFLKNEYLLNLRPNPGLHSLPSGSAYYEACLTWFIGDDVTADLIHNVGQVRIREILTEVDNSRYALLLKGYSNECTFMRIVKRHRHQWFTYRPLERNPGGLQADHSARDSAPVAIRVRLPSPRKRRVTTLHRSTPTKYLTHFRVVEMTFPGPDAVLMPGDEVTGQPAVFFVNLNNIFKRQKWKLLTTALHEYIPGRHFQNIHEKNQSMPYFRKYRDYRKLHRVPYHFPIHSSFTEGWALYAESLGFDMGLYERTYDRLGAHFSELMHMVKMVVDTGIHSKGWTETQAVNYIMTLTGCGHSEASITIQNIVTSPGKSVAPPYGMMKIKMLRQKAEKLLGTQFYLPDFHRHLLNLGPMSLRNVEREMDEWISRGSAQRMTSPSLIFIITWLSLNLYLI